MRRSGLLACGYVAALLALASWAPVAGAQVQVRARLDSAEMLLGDPNRLVVRVRGADGDVRVGWEVLDTMEAFVATGDERVERRSDGLTLALPFSVYDSAGLLFPRLPVYVGAETLLTNDLALLVDFPPGDSTLNPYRPLDAEPARLSDYLPWILGGAAMLALLVGALYFFYFAREDKPAAPPPPPVPPHERALAALRVLRKRTDLEDKAYYSSLDRILRDYLEGRYGVPALERTSTEVLALLREEALPPELPLDELLAQVDLVKFAKAELPAERRTEALARVEAFVRATTPAPRAPEPDETHSDA